MVFTDNISQALDRKNPVDVSYNDFVKAFNKVGTFIHLNKHDYFDFSGKFHRGQSWFFTFIAIYHI